MARGKIIDGAIVREEIDPRGRVIDVGYLIEMPDSLAIVKTTGETFRHFEEIGKKKEVSLHEAHFTVPRRRAL